MIVFGNDLPLSCYDFDVSVPQVFLSTDPPYSCDFQVSIQPLSVVVCFDREKREPLRAIAVELSMMV